MIITFGIIQSFSSSDVVIALNSHQFRLLGFGYPPKRGWIEDLIDKDVPDETVRLVRSLRHMPKKERNQILTESGISPAKLFQSKLL